MPSTQRMQRSGGTGEEGVTGKIEGLGGLGREAGRGSHLNSPKQHVILKPSHKETPVVLVKDLQDKLLHQCAGAAKSGAQSHILSNDCDVRTAAKKIQSNQNA